MYSLMKKKIFKKKYLKKEKTGYQKFYINYFKINLGYLKYMKFKNNYFTFLKNVKKKKFTFFKFVFFKLRLKTLKKSLNKYLKIIRLPFLTYKKHKKIYFLKEEFYLKNYLYRYKNKNFYNDRIRYHLYFLYFPNFVKKIKNLYGFKYFQYNFYNLYGFKYNFILNVRNKIKGELSLNLNPVNIFLTFNFINIYSNYYLFNNFVCLSYHLRKKIFSNKLFLSLYFQLIKNKLFFFKNKKLKKYNFFKYERFCNKYLSHNIFFKKKYYRYNYNNYRSRSFKIYSKIKYRYNYKLNVKPKILNLILFNVYNYYFKTLNFRKYIFKKYSKKLFLNNFKIKQRIQRIKPKKLKFIFKTYKKYRLLNFKLNNINMKKINLTKILKFKNLISLNFKKNQNLLLFVTLIRGFSFDTTLNQFIVDIDYFSNKLFSLLSLFSIENVNSFGINLESMRSRSNFLVYNYFKTIKLNMFEKLYKNFKLLVKKKKNNLKIKKNRHFRIYKRAINSNFIHSYALIKRLKSNQKKETYISKRFLFKYLEYFFSLTLFKFNFNLILFGFKQNENFLLPMIKIIKIKSLKNFKSLQNNFSKFSFFMHKKTSVSIKFIFNKFILNNLIDLFIKDIILFFILYFFFRNQIKKLILRKILCHN